MSSAETAELIDLPFGLWTRVDRRKHEFSRIHQVAPMCPSPDECDRSVHMQWRCSLMSNYFDHLFPYLFTALCFRLRIDLLCFQGICRKLLITGN